ncbi:MAG: hypothetical protein ACI8YQ_005335, partial [Polaribacter sp.]
YSKDVFFQIAVVHQSLVGSESDYKKKKCA